MRSEITTRVSLSGGDDVKRQLEQIGAAGEKALADLSRSSGAAGKDLEHVSAASGDLHTILLRIGEATGGGFGSGIFAELSSAAEGFNTALGVTIGVVAGVVAGLGALAVEGSKVASEIKEGATRVGVSAEDYTKLKFAFEQSGASGEVFEKAMAKILEASNTAADAAKKNAEEVVKANQAIEASAVAASEAARTRAMQNYEQARSMVLRLSETLRTLRQNLADSIEKIDREEADNSFANQNRSNEEIIASRNKFNDQRLDLQRQAAKQEQEINRKAAQEAFEQKRKQDLEEAEAARKRNKEREEELKKFNKTIEDAANSAGNAFEGLGVKLIDAAGNARDPANSFRDIAEAIGKIEDPAQRSAKVIELFTRRIGANMVEALSEGRVGLDTLGKEAESLGLVFTELDRNTGKSLLDIGKHFSDTISKLGNVVSANSAKIGLAFAPLFDKVADALAKAFGGAQGPMVEAAQSLAKAITPIFDDLVKVIEGDFEKINSGFVRFIIPIFQVLGGVIAGFGRTVATAFQLLMAASQEVADLLNEVFGTKLVAGDIPAFAVAILGVIKVVGALAVAFRAATIAAAPLLLLFAAVAAAVVLLVAPLDKMTEQVRELFGDRAAEGFRNFTIGFREVVVFLLEGLASMSEAATAFKSIFVNAWQLIVDTLSQKSKDLSEGASAFVSVFVNLYNLIKDGALAAAGWLSTKFDEAFTAITNGVNTIVSWFTGAYQSIKDGWQSVVDFISGKIDVLLGFFRSLIDKAKEVASAVAGAVAGGGGAVPAFARGGMAIAAAMGGLIIGAGTGTSDSIHALVSNGEYIHQAAAVDYYGRHIFDALNRMTIPRASLISSMRSPAIPAFAFGGPISSMPPPSVRFAGGGEVIAGGAADRVSVDLTHHGKTFPGLLAPRMIADSLVSHATEQATLSAGQPPGWTSGRR